MSTRSWSSWAPPSGRGLVVVRAEEARGGLVYEAWQSGEAEEAAEEAVPEVRAPASELRGPCL